MANRIERRVGMLTAVVGKHWLTAALFPILALGAPPAVIAAVWATVNLLVSILNVIQMRYMLTVVPADVLGRVQGSVNVASYGGMPLGLVATGLALDGLGGRTTVLVFSAVLVVLALYARMSRDLRTGDVAGEAQDRRHDRRRTRMTLPGVGRSSRWRVRPCAHAVRCGARRWPAPCRLS